ncbi:carboxymuconolactone decarboxylase family protein [Nocardioides daejeonensis]|uniref:carboxymuconolactone decarboxylase family protein n=1 Tax=Nocardioides daejeonensis TaxID=1046556 RepID=UPI000D74FC03|nr:carboxymuconolactone decarboxylase family protein [Nocardioides daejeonensis]
MSRLAALVPGGLAPEQQEVYDAIAGGRRAQGRQLFELKAPDGSLNGPFGVMLHAPSVGLALQDLGAAIRYRTSMTDRGREIAILMVAVATASDFEWYAHERVGLAVGLSEAELAALMAGRFTSTDAQEEAIALVCDALLGTTGLDEAAYATAVAALGETQLIEVTTLVGYYRTLAQLMEVFAVDAPEPVTWPAERSPA